MIINNTLSHSLNYIMRVFAWSFNYLVIWPIVATVLMTAILFWQKNTTPGTEIVRAVSAAHIDKTPGEFLISKCEPINVDDMKRGLPVPPVCEKKLLKVNSNQYATYLDKQLWGIVKVLWVTLAVVFGLIAFSLRTFPDIRSGGHKQYAYGKARKISSEAKETE